MGTPVLEGNVKEFGEGRFVACASFVAAYILVYVAVGTFDSAADAYAAANDIARHDMERMLSAAFDVSAVVGLASLWPLGARSWLGGSAVGILTGLAAGGFHVAGHMGAWLPIALCAGFAGGSAFLALAKKRPSACALIAVEASLATLQVLFIVAG